MPEPTWKSADGPIAVSQMTDTHLFNASAYVRRYMSTLMEDYWYFDPFTRQRIEANCASGQEWIDRFDAELEDRRLKRVRVRAMIAFTT